MTEENPTPTNSTQGTPEPVSAPPGATNGDADTFPRSYVEQLRRENAESRTKAKMADTFRDALRDAALKSASAGVLHEPLAWSDDFNNEDGMPDSEKIREAAEALAAEKPWLSRVRGDAGQGFRGEGSDTTVNLAELLRDGA